MLHFLFIFRVEISLLLKLVAHVLDFLHKLRLLLSEFFDCMQFALKQLNLFFLFRKLIFPRFCFRIIRRLDLFTLLVCLNLSLLQAPVTETYDLLEL